MPRPHVLVAVERLDLAHVVFHEAPQHLPLGQKERDAGARIRREREQLEVLADLAVVPRPGLLEPPQIRIEFLLRRPGRTVDAGEHRVLLVAAPVGPRYVLQLEGAEPHRPPTPPRSRSCRGCPRRAPRPRLWRPPRALSEGPAR